jgi:hypothetical protein
VASPLIGGLPVPKGADMKDTQIHAQYSTGLSRRNIEQALVAAGKVTVALTDGRLRAIQAVAHAITH